MAVARLAQSALLSADPAHRPALRPHNPAHMHHQPPSLQRWLLPGWKLCRSRQSLVPAQGGCGDVIRHSSWGWMQAVRSPPCRRKEPASGHLRGVCVALQHFDDLAVSVALEGSNSLEAAQIQLWRRPRQDAGEEQGSSRPGVELIQ